MRRAIVLGAGISGLAFAQALRSGQLAWQHRRQAPAAWNVALVEAQDRVGGWMNSVQVTGASGRKYVLERGCRTIRPRGGKSGAVISLISELNLQNDVMLPSKAASQRFLYMDQELQKLPSGLLDLFTTQIGRDLFMGVMNDLRAPKPPGHEETIAEFMSRRFSPRIASTVVDGFISGIFAGDAAQLSTAACLPALVTFEKEHGSIVRGMLASIGEQFKGQKAAAGSAGPPETESWRQAAARAGSLSFRYGLSMLSGSLLEELQHDPSVSVWTGTRALQIEKRNGQLGVVLENAQHTTWEPADAIICALPAHALAPVLDGTASTASSIASSMRSTSVWAITAAYAESLLPKAGFGYLIPSKEKECIMGMTWDSCVFPQMSLQAGPESRVTVMMGGEHNRSWFDKPEELVQTTALETAARHLKVPALTKPDYVVTGLAKNCITQYTPGHVDRVQSMQADLNTHLSGTKLLGASYYGVGVNDCIASARAMAETLAKS